MKSVALVARGGPWAAVVIWTALATGLLPIASSVAGAVGRLDSAASGEQTLQPFRVEIDGEALRISVPSTWRRLEDARTVMFAPEDGHAQLAGKAHVFYGIELGVTRATRRDPSGALDAVVQPLKSANPAFRSASITRLVTLAGRLGLRGTFSNTSLVTGRPEFVVIAAAPVEHDRALYVVGVAPEERFGVFRPTFEAILLSVETTR